MVFHGLLFLPVPTQKLCHTSLHLPNFKKMISLRIQEILEWVHTTYSNSISNHSSCRGPPPQSTLKGTLLCPWTLGECWIWRKLLSISTIHAQRHIIMPIDFRWMSNMKEVTFHLRPRTWQNLTKWVMYRHGYAVIPPLSKKLPSVFFARAQKGGGFQPLNESQI